MPRHSSAKRKPELTPAQFEVVAQALRTVEPARTAARLVLVEGYTITAAAALAGVLQPSASRVVKRCREIHEKILMAYAKIK